MRHPSRLVALLLVALFALATLAAASAAGPDPAVYFTANWPTPDPAAVTALETALLDRLSAATTSIDAALYDFSRPSLRDALLAAHARGVQVRVGSDDAARASDASKNFYDALQAAGILLVDDAGDSRVMHNKYAIIDGQAVWTGSTNWSENDITQNHNNAVVFTSAAVAAVYQHDFDQMWAGRFGEAKTASPVTALTYDGSPLEVYFSPQDGALDQVIAEVNAAQTSIDFAIFFFTDDRLANALIAAYGRGVQVRGLFDELGAGSAGRERETLCEAGVAVAIENTPGKMHNKLMVLDAGGKDGRVVTGSFNWSAAGAGRDSENIAILHDAETAQASAAAFAQWWEGSLYLSCAIQAPGHALYLPLALRGTEAPE